MTPTSRSAAGQLDGQLNRQSIGQTLLAAGLVTPEQLERALERAASEGGLLGRHLILEAGLDRRRVYEVLARQWDAPLVDLMAEPPADELMEQLGYSEVGEPQWLPWRMDGDVLVVASAVAPSAQIAEEATRRFGVAGVEFRTTTDWDINQSIQRSFRRHLLYESAERLAEERPGESARIALTQWQRYLPVVLVAGIMLAFVISPLTAIIVLLAAANIVFLVSIGFKSLASLRYPFDQLHDSAVARARDRERARRGLPPVAQERVPDSELPVYTILVPVFREANIIDKLLTNLGQLDYPRSKLDVLVLLEEDDAETIAAAKASRPRSTSASWWSPGATPKPNPGPATMGSPLPVANTW